MRPKRSIIAPWSQLPAQTRPWTVKLTMPTSYTRLIDRRDDIGNVTRKRCGGDFKAKLALEVIRGEQTFLPRAKTNDSGP